MSPVVAGLINLLITALADELRKRYPALPVRIIQQLSFENAEILIRFFTDDVQREAELRALYAKAEYLLSQALAEPAGSEA